MAPPQTVRACSLGTSEEITGTVLNELAPREEVQIATKVFARVRDARNAPA